MTPNPTRILPVTFNTLEEWPLTISAAGTPVALLACDIERLDDEHFALTMAVPGFADHELCISTHNGHLKVAGRKPTPTAGSVFLYREIVTEDFERTFQLAPYVEVGNAQLMHGLLRIELMRVLPEALRPRRIEIKAAGPQRLLESNDNCDTAA